MWWLLPVAYIIIFGKRRSPCETPKPAEPADEPATTATTSAHSDAATSVVTGDGVDIEPVDDAPTRQDILDALHHMSKTAGALRRQGYTGIHGQSYKRIHATIDGLLYDLAAMDLEANNEMA